MTERHDPMRWQEVLEANPNAKKGMFNPERLELLKPGVFVVLDRLTAASWMPILRERMKTAGEVLNIMADKNLIEKQDRPIKVTIVEIGTGVNEDKILVEAEGVQEWIHASIFSNSIMGEDTSVEFLSTKNTEGWAPPPDFGGNVG
jgi:hypothetical protein